MIFLCYFDIHFWDSPDSLNGLGIPGNNWIRRFAVTYAKWVGGGGGIMGGY